MGWAEQVPSSIAFVDVETTGLSGRDRVVSLGAVWLSTASVRDGPLPVSFIHLVFNPGQPCERGAYKVHGYSDDFLSKQDPFSIYANFIRNYLDCADLIVAHNASFDLPFINRELQFSGADKLDVPSYCTMQGYRQHSTGSAALASVCAEIGLRRDGRTHGALEDAWLAMMVYLWLHDCPFVRPFSDAGRFIDPFNIRASSSGQPVARAASNTGRSSAPTTAEAARIDAIVNYVKQAKRENRYADAEDVLLQEINHQERVSRRDNIGVAPWYYEQLAIICSQQGRYGDELAILQRYDRQRKAPGATPAQLKARLEKLLTRRFATVQA